MLAYWRKRHTPASRGAFGAQNAQLSDQSAMVIHRVLAVVVLAAYPVAGLYPFDWQSPLVANAAARSIDGSLTFVEPGMAMTENPPEWLPTAVETGAFEIRMLARSSTPKQSGPARLLTVSSDPYNRNVTLGQEGDDLVVRLRTSETDLNGIPEHVVAGVFAEPRWISLSLHVGAQGMVVEIGGDSRLRRDLPGGGLSTWDTAYELALGNELTGDRPWLGTIAQATVVGGGTEVDYLQPEALTLPPLLRRWHQEPRALTMEGTNARDVALNLLGFLPLGLLVGFGMRSRPSWQGVLVIVSVSTLIELNQIWLPTRYPSAFDLFLNAAGGTLGIKLAAALRERRAT